MSRSLVPASGTALAPVPVSGLRHLSWPHVLVLQAMKGMTFGSQAGRLLHAELLRQAAEASEGIAAAYDPKLPAEERARRLAAARAEAMAELKAARDVVFPGQGQVKTRLPADALRLALSFLEREPQPEQLTLLEPAPAAPLVRTFDGHPITTVEFHGQQVFFVDELATALGYADKGNLADLLRREWSDEMEEGEEYLVVTNGDIRALEALTGRSDSGSRTESPRGQGKGGGGARKLIVLTEAGAHLVCIKTEKPAGKRLRRWLAREVLPAIRRTGTYQATETAAPTDPALEERLRRLELAVAGRVAPAPTPTRTPEQVEARRRKMQATTMRREATRSLNLHLITPEEWLTQMKLADQVAGGR